MAKDVGKRELRKFHDTLVHLFADVVGGEEEDKDLDEG